MLSTLIEFIRDLLPSGPFWQTAAVEKFVRALAASLEPLAAETQKLRNSIFPGTADRDVLLQYWDFVRSDCVATPTDTEDLRARVIDALGARPGHTFAGLTRIVAASLPYVELRHLLPVSSVPMDVPGDVCPYARILEVWYSPVLDVPEVVNCVVRDVAQAADLLRLVAPASEWRYLGPTAAEGALAWVQGPSCRVHAERAPSPGAGAAETVELVLPERHGVLAIEELFPSLSAGDLVLGREFRWRLERDFGSGWIPVTAEQAFYQAPSSTSEVLTVLTAMTASYCWAGLPTDIISSETLVASGAPAQGVSVPGLAPNNHISAAGFEFDDGVFEAWQAQNANLFDFDATNGPSWIFCLVFRTTAGPPPALRNLYGDRLITGEGAEINLASTGAVQWNVDSAFLQISGNYADDALHTVVVRWRYDTGQIDMATELAATGPAAAIGPVTSAPAAAIGSGRLAAASVQVPAFIAFAGQQTHDSDLLAVAQAIHRQMVTL